MSNGPLDFSLAASFDWETLLPVIFFVLYGIAQLLGSKKKKGAPAEEESVDDVDMEERARQIREEIRRKIEERRRAREGQSSPAPQPAPAQRRARYDPTMPESQQRRFSQPAPQEPEPVQRQRPQPVARSRPEPAVPRQSGIEERLQEQRAILERARKEQREAKAKARQMMAAAGAGRGKQQHRAAAVSSGNLRDQLLTDLRNPLSTRKAVLLREVLGTPLGLK